MIQNAVQYSDSESTINVKTSINEGLVVFQVQDFGIGIEQKYLKNIFEKFFRVPGTNEKGTGLGLAISKEFITKQNGTIWAESKPGYGSSFFFGLPVFQNHKNKTS